MGKHYNNLLYKKVEAKGFKPQHVAEVGVWHPNTSNIYPFIKKGVLTTLVEPDPESIKLIKEEFVSDKNVKLYELALCDFNGEVELCKRESSTFITNLPNSPALTNDDCNIEQTEKFIAKASLFGEIDDGTIDLISIDTEGSEWYVIKNMKSKPKVISIETHGGMYVNPYLKELLNWMDEHNYALWYKDKSDSVFVLKTAFPLLLIDKVQVLKSDFIIMFKARKKRLGKSIKQLIGINT